MITKELSFELTSVLSVKIIKCIFFEDRMMIDLIAPIASGRYSEPQIVRIIFMH
jgi:hypothetical protein